MVSLVESSKKESIEVILFKEESNDAPINDCVITDSESDKPEITNKKVFNCDLCPDTMDNRLDVINAHLKEFHKSDGIKCEQCLFVGYSQEILTTHIARSHKTNEIQTCPICNKTFTKRYKFNKHKLSHNKERPHQCPNCDNNYKTIWSLKHHVASVHTHTLKKVVCDTCGKTIRETSLQSHLRTHIKKQTYPCQFCNKILFSEKTLLEHVQIKHEKKPRNYRLLCYICGIGIKSKGTLKDHLLVHTREKPYNCEKCDKRYRTKAALSGHIARAHLDVRNHICSICGRGFYDRVILENHTRTHTGERPFKCHVCDKCFSFQAALRTHMKIHTKTYALMSNRYLTFSKIFLTNFNSACNVWRSMTGEVWLQS